MEFNNTQYLFNLGMEIDKKLQPTGEKVESEDKGIFAGVSTAIDGAVTRVTDFVGSGAARVGLVLIGTLLLLLGVYKYLPKKA